MFHDSIERVCVIPLVRGALAFGSIAAQLDGPRLPLHGRVMVCSRLPGAWPRGLDAELRHLPGPAGRLDIRSGPVGPGKWPCAARASKPPPRMLQSERGAIARISDFG